MNRAEIISIRGGLPSVLRSAGDRLQFRERLREEAAEVVRQAFPRRGLKRFGTLKYALSRARNGCKHNPLYRLAEWFIALRLVGVSVDVVRLLLDFLNDLVRLLWAPESRDPVRLSRQTQGAVARLLPLLGDYIGGDRSQRRLFLESARTARAVIDELVLALQEDDWRGGLQAAA